MAGRGALNAVMLVQVQLPQLRHYRFVRATARMSDPASRTTTEVIRPDQQFPDGLPPRGVWGSEWSEEGFARTMGLVRLALS